MTYLIPYFIAKRNINKDKVYFIDDRFADVI